MTPTKRALNVLNAATISQAERNAIIKLAGDLARADGLLQLIASRHVTRAMRKLGIKWEVTR